MNQEEIDKEQLLRYLRGEIPFEQWVQGQQIYEQSHQFALNTDLPLPSQPQERQDDEDEDDDDDEEEDEGGKGEEEAGPSTYSGQGYSPIHEMEIESNAGDEDLQNTADSALNIEMQVKRGRRRGPVDPPEFRSRRRRRNRVPKRLRGLMGQAHLCFARREHDQATKMCMEIIRQAPKGVEPFQLLGMIYEDLGDMEKSMQFQLIAAHLSPRDTEQWHQLAEVCLERNDLEKAIYCYSKVLRTNSHHIPTLHARARLYIRLGENKKAMESYHTIIKHLPQDEWSQGVLLARELVQRCHKLGEVNLAIEAMETLVKRYPEHISSEEVNNLAELYISSLQYEKAIQVMSRHCGVIVEYNEMDLSTFQGGDSEAVNVVIPDGLPIDLRVKLAICLIHSKHLTPVPMVTKPLFSEDPEDFGDLYLDVAEAYIDINDHQSAKPILAALLKAKNYNLPAVWLRYAECLSSLGELAASSKAYSEVLKQAPRHLDARLALAAIEQQLGRAESALQTLSLDPLDDDDDGDYILSKQDIQILYRQGILMYTQGHFDEFLEKGNYLLSKFIHKDNEDHADYNVITKGEWLSLIQKMCVSYGKMKRYGQACNLIKDALNYNIYDRDIDKPWIQKLKFMLVCASYHHENYDDAFSSIREFVNQWGEKINLMNLFSLIVNNTLGSRHHKYCMRLTIKFYPDSTALSIINGHNALQTSSYKHAIGEYVRAYHHDLSNPFLPLCIGVSLFALAAQRFTVNKDSIITQGYACLRLYQKLRGDTQETNYNIGRALQQVAIDHLAVHYYHKALGLPPIIPYDDRYDLRPQIAFNLSLIYRANGNTEMALELLETYCVI
ncbi:general transcription factor 3C polypeptide 3-like isoform X2 [Lytechinus pictus]|uniref:general transcription factor 3C polypeptide 3-like isoform X2 n=1 Tax=Lytechinus pictus TaxID=7653 RepID=UPI0030BA1767